MKYLIEIYNWFQPYIEGLFWSGLFILAIILLTSLYIDVDHFITSLYGGDDDGIRN